MFAHAVLVVAGAAIASAQYPAGWLGNAERKTDNPLGTVYVANFYPTTGSSISGAVFAVSSDEGKGVLLSINLHGLPTENQPLPYHIHELAVPEDGNCMKTLAHLDPYARSEDPGCDASAPETCQVGDLSGKYGKIFGNSLKNSYVDQFISLKKSDNSYIGNRSIVIHYANKTRIACANFFPISEGITEDCLYDLEDSDSAPPSSLPAPGENKPSPHAPTRVAVTDPLPSVTGSVASTTGAYPPQFTGAAMRSVMMSLPAAVAAASASLFSSRVRCRPNLPSSFTAGTAIL